MKGSFIRWNVQLILAPVIPKLFKGTSAGWIPSMVCSRIAISPGVMPTTNMWC
jgi:hypothetical protein